MELIALFLFLLGTVFHGMTLFDGTLNTMEGKAQSRYLLVTLCLYISIIFSSLANIYS